MPYRGHIENGVVVLDEPVSLPDGMEVTVLPSDDTPRGVRTTKQSIEGLWSDLGIDISERDISEARNDMWGGFPRELSAHRSVSFAGTKTETFS